MPRRRQQKRTGSWSVVPAGKRSTARRRHSRPVVMERSKADALASVRDRNRRPGRRRFTAVKDDTVRAVLPKTKTGRPSLSKAKRAERRRRKR